MFLTTLISFFFFFNDTATTEIYTLSLHDALPIYWILGMAPGAHHGPGHSDYARHDLRRFLHAGNRLATRSEEHTSELQSLTNLVCRLLLEKKKRNESLLTPRSYSQQSCRRGTYIS